MLDGGRGRQGVRKGRRDRGGREGRRRQKGKWGRAGVARRGESAAVKSRGVSSVRVPPPAGARSDIHAPLHRRSPMQRDTTDHAESAARYAEQLPLPI